MNPGDKVTYHVWIKGELTPWSATVVRAIGTPDEALELLVDFTDEVVVAEGYTREQSHAPKRTRHLDNVHDSGTWSPVA